MLSVNPICLLEEYGRRIGKKPVYDLLKADLQARPPIFTIRVSVGEMSCTAEGLQKKLAKRKAAYAALKKLKGGPVGVGVGVDGLIGVDMSTDGDSSQTDMKTSGSSQQSECNPVGALQMPIKKNHRPAEVDRKISVTRKKDSVPAVRGKTLNL